MVIQLSYPEELASNSGSGDCKYRLMYLPLHGSADVQLKRYLHYIFLEI